MTFGESCLGEYLLLVVVYEILREPLPVLSMGRDEPYC